MTTATYDPKDVSITFKGTLIGGYTDGDFIEVEQSEETFTLKAGCDGAVTRTHNRNETGKATLTLMAESPTNDTLRDIWENDKKFHNGIGSFFMKDRNSNTLVEADEAWLTGPPKVGYGKESGEREWTIAFAKVDIKAGGAKNQ